MKKLSLILIASILLSCGDAEKPEGYVNFNPLGSTTEYDKTTYYFIRHAEKDLTTEENPQLTFEGIKRSNYWAEYFTDKQLTAFYTTKFTRNYQTLIPIMHNFKGKPKVYELKTDSLFSETFWKDTYGKNVVVVGHNNTTPQFVNEILRKDKYTTIEDGVYGNLYKVEIDEAGFIKDTLLNFEEINLSEELLKELEYIKEAEEVEFTDFSS